MNRKKCIIISIVCMLTLFTTLSAVIGEADKVFKTPAHHPTAICFDGKLIWMADTGTHKLYALDPENGTVKNTLDAPGFQPRGLAWDGKLLWCIDGKAGWLYGIDIKTGTAEKILESNAANPGGLVFDGKFLWMLDKGAKKILKINRIDGMMHENIPAPSASGNDLAFDGTYFWVTDNADNMLYRSDPSTGNVVTFLRANGPYPYGICWDGNTLWNVDYQEEKLFRLDLQSKETKARRNPKEYYWEITREFHNFGPGTVPEADAYLAIPGNRDNQEILTEIVYEPKPESFVTDRWGQRFAHFHHADLVAGTFITSRLKLKTRLYEVEHYVFPERVGAMKDIPKDVKKYLVDGFKYDINHPVMQKAVKEAVGNETRPYWIMRNIFDYILQKIDYKLKPLGGWNPAPTVLARGTGSCSEYSFVFIGMCRAAGLPARYVGSVVVRDEDKGIDDVWHRWPEVYLPNYGWVPVDPSAEGHRAYPGGIGRLIGSVGNRFLITTSSGGGSKYLDFYYNFNSHWKTKGICKISSQQYAEFTPLSKGDDKNTKKANSCKL